MKHVLTKETLIDRVLRPIGTIIDGIATPGEIESLLFVGRARRVPDPKTDDADDSKDDPEPTEPEETEPEETELEASEELEPEQTELQQEQIDEVEGEADEPEASDLESWVRGQGLPANVFDSLYDAGIRSMEQLGEKLAQDGYRLSSVNGIGPKTEARIREAFTA